MVLKIISTLILPFRAYVQNVLEVLSNSTVCPRSLGPFYIVSYYMNWVKTCWTYSVIKMDKIGSVPDTFNGLNPKF